MSCIKTIELSCTSRDVERITAENQQRRRASIAQARLERLLQRVSEERKVRRLRKYRCFSTGCYVLLGSMAVLAVIHAHLRFYDYAAAAALMAGLAWLGGMRFADLAEEGGNGNG